MSLPQDSLPQDGLPQVDSLHSPRIQPARGKACCRLDYLLDESTPQFAQLVTWILLATALVLALVPLDHRVGPRQGPVTLLSWLPADVLHSPAMLLAMRGVLLVGAGLWLFQRLLPWSCWLTVIGFTGVWSLHVETTYNAAHIFHMANNLLVIQALWVTFYAREIRASLRAGTYWTTPLVPRWVVLAGVAYIGIFHTAAGLTKLIYSGPAWANGVSLQLWTHLFSPRHWMPSASMILGSRTLAAALQWGTLVIETAGVLAIFPRLRTAIGVGLLAFYAGVLLTFDYGFHFNALFTALYFLPFDRWLTRPAHSLPER